MLKRDSPPFSSPSSVRYNIKSSTSLSENPTMLSLWPADGKTFAWSRRARRDDGPVWIRGFLFSSFLQEQNLNEIPSSPSVRVINVIFSILSIAHASASFWRKKWSPSSLYHRFYPKYCNNGHKLWNIRSFHHFAIRGGLNPPHPTPKIKETV